jgi:hypothetical protein
MPVYYNENDHYVAQFYAKGWMRAYLIDPEARTIRTIELPDKGMFDEMRRIIGPPSGGMDHALLSDALDTIWVDEFGLKRGERVHAFRLPMQREPFAGRAIVIGEDRSGLTRPPFIPIEMLMRDVDWLGVIVPAVEWIEETNGARAVVTYSRPKA